MTDPTPQPPGYVRWAAKTLEDAGYETWAVGGAIRNTLLGIPSGDWDLATRAHPKVVRRLFPRTVPVGIALFQGLHGETPWGNIMAASVLSVTPVIVLTLVFQRRIIGGLTRGAVKG